VSFVKEPAVRFLSHHDVMRAFHRALRRGDLPVRMTEGYNQRPRVVFPHALEVGIASEDEVVEIELTSWVQPAEFLRRLAAALPEGLRPTACRLTAPRRQSSVAIEAHYRIGLGPGAAAAARDGIARFVAADAWPIERVDHKGRVRTIDVRPHVVGLTLEGDDVLLRLRLGQAGAARPREVLGAVLGASEQDVLGMAIVKTKTVLTGPS
jgi:radical SAM-linked protein